MVSARHLKLLLALFALVIANCKASLDVGSEDSSTQTQFDGCVAATPLGAQSIRLEFEFPAEAQQLNVFRDGTLISSFSSSSVTQLVDKDLQEGAAYTYTCEAIFKGLGQVGNKAITINTLAFNPPIFSGVQNAVGTSAKTALLSWNEPSPSGPATDYFKVYVQKGSSMDWSNPRLEVESAFFSDVANLGDELPYIFGVRACTYNDICDSNTTTIVQNLVDGGIPQTTGITNAIAANGNVTLTAPWQETQGAVATRRVFLRIGPAGGTNLANYSLKQTFVVPDLANPPTELLVAGISENTEYHFIVQDEDPSGNINTNYIPYNMNIGDITPPLFGGLTSLTNGTPADTQLDYSFTAIASQPGDPNGATDYVVYAKFDLYPNAPGDACQPGATTMATLPAAAYTSGQNVNATLTGLTPRTTYDICVKARDAAGNLSNTTNHILRTALDITAPTFGGAQAITFNSGTGQLDIAWNPSTSGDVKEYQLKIWKNTTTPSTGDITTLLRDAGTYPNGVSLSQSDYGFGDLETIYIAVNACDDADVIPSGAQNCNNYPTDGTAKNVTLPDVSPPPGFMGIMAAPNLVSSVEGEMTIPWNIPVPWGIDYRGFRVYMVNPDDSLTLLKDCNCLTGGSNLTCDTPPYGQCDITGLDAYRTYEFHVRAYDASSNETQLDVNINTAAKLVIDTTAPTFSSNLNIGAAPLQTLSWQSATDNQYSGAINYKLYRKDNTTFGDAFNPSADGTLVTTTVGLNYTDSAATMGITVFYAICAEDQSGNETCDGNIKARFVADSLSPVVLALLDDKGGVDDKDWNVTWTNSDNVGVIQVDVYKKITDSPEVLNDTNVGDPGVNLIATGTSTLNSVLGETGPVNQDKYINYLVVLQDAAGNKGSASRSVYSKNTITVTSISRNQGSPLGGRFVIVTGDGFSPGVTVKMDTGNCTHPDTGSSTVFYKSSTTLYCISPAQTGPAVADVTVENVDGSQGVLVGGYQYASADPCDDQSGWADFADGSGTIGDPYIICNGNHLSNIRMPAYLGTSKYFEIGDNIFLGGFNTNMAAPDFLPIGDGANLFTGFIDGKNYLIYDYHFEDAARQNAGLFGYVSNSSITNFNIEKFSLVLNQHSGSLAGRMDDSIFQDINAENISITAPSNYVGGVVGRGIRNNIQNIAVTDIDITCGYSCGGAFGVADNDTIFTNVSVSGGTLDSTSYLGGVIGMAVSLNITNTWSNITVIGASASGGVIGNARRASISNVYSLGAVASVASNQPTGGVVGLWQCETAGPFTIDEIYSTANITSSAPEVGGLLGEIDSCPTQSITMSNSYSKATISGSTKVGGLIGSITQVQSLTVNNSYVTGAVGAVSQMGGLIGNSDVGTGPITITDSFWYYDAATPSLGTTQPTSVGGGTTKTLVEMQTQATFDPPWDFTTVWEINPGEFPKLQWQP